MAATKAQARKATGSKPVRVNESTHVILGWLSSELGVSMQDVIEAAVEDLRRKRILQATNDAYAALRKNPAAWAELEKENAEWDVALLDGLE